MKYIYAHATLAVLLALPSVSSAALLDRGGGLIYDDILNVTWLQDANLPKTIGYDIDGPLDGRLKWRSAKAFANSLIYYDSVRQVYYDDWRLPSVKPIGDNFVYTESHDGLSDVGYGITSPNSELAHLWSVSLGNVAGGGLQHHGPFFNLQSYPYWSGSDYWPNATYENVGWAFSTERGWQDGLSGLYEINVLFVRDGDVLAVPEPGSGALIMLSLSSFLLVRRKFTTSK